MTFRNLLWMVEGRQRDQWNHTAALMAQAKQLHTGKPVKFHDFYPFDRPLEDKWAEMKAMFSGK